MKPIVTLIALILTGNSYARSIMAEYNYRLRVNQDYHTGLNRAYDAPVAGSRITIQQRGSYCNILVTKVQYNTVDYGTLREARPAGNGQWEIPDGAVYAIDVSFRQTFYDDVNCELKIYSETGGGPETPPPAPKPQNDCDYMGGHGTPKETGNWYRIHLPLIASDFKATKPYRDGFVQKLNQPPARVICYTNCIWDQTLDCRDLLKSGDNVLETWFREMATMHMPLGTGTAKIFGGFNSAEDTTNSH